MASHHQFIHFLTNVSSMSNKLYLFIPTCAVALTLGAGSVLAYGGPQMMGDPATRAVRFDNQITHDAAILGISVDEMKNYWAAGKNIAAIAKEKGITADDLTARIKSERIAEQKQVLQELVQAGKITQAQADARLAAQQTRMNSGKGHRGFGGMMQGWVKKASTNK